jgi:hypothetical protein
MLACNVVDNQIPEDDTEYGSMKFSRYLIKRYFSAFNNGGNVIIT